MPGPLPAHTRRLSALVNRPGGITAEEAVRAAEERLDTIREASVQEIAVMLDRMCAIGSRCANEDHPDPALRNELYTVSNTLVGVGGVFGMAELGEIAFSLCTLLDRLQQFKSWNTQAIQLHLNSLRVVFSGDQDGPGKRKIVEALRQVAGRFAKQP